jgi:hypothetical protein
LKSLPAGPKTHVAMPSAVTAEEAAQKKFNEDDKRWNGPRFIGLGLVTLVICITAIYLMSTTQGCSLQIVP